MHRPLTTQTDEDLQNTNRGDTHESWLVVVVQPVQEYPAINPHNLSQDEGQDVAVEQKLPGVVQADALDEFVDTPRGRRRTRHDCRQRIVDFALPVIS